MFVETLVQDTHDITDAIEASGQGHVVVTREPVKGDCLHSGQARVPCGTFTIPENAAAKAHKLINEGHTVYVRFVTVSEIRLRKEAGKDE